MFTHLTVSWEATRARGTCREAGNDAAALLGTKSHPPFPTLPSYSTLLYPPNRQVGSHPCPRGTCREASNDAAAEPDERRGAGVYTRHDDRSDTRW